MNPRQPADNPLSRLAVTQQSIDKVQSAKNLEIGSEVTSVSVGATDPKPALTIGALQEMADKEKAAKQEVEDKKEENAEDAMLSDMDLEDFYLTGKLEYTFKLGGKVPVRFRTLTSAELMESNQFLFDNAQTSRSYNVVMAEHSVLVLSKCLMQYGQTDLGNKPEAERAAFIKAMPSPVMYKLSKKYSQFEATAVKLVNDTDKTKN